MFFLGAPNLPQAPHDNDAFEKAKAWIHAARARRQSSAGVLTQWVAPSNESAWFVDANHFSLRSLCCWAAISDNLDNRLRTAEIRIITEVREDVMVRRCVPIVRVLVRVTEN